MHAPYLLGLLLPSLDFSLIVLPFLGVVVDNGAQRGNDCFEECPAAKKIDEI